MQRIGQAQPQQCEHLLTRCTKSESDAAAAAKPSATLPELEKAIPEALDANGEIKSVKTVKGTLTIRTNIRSITNTMYYAMLPTVCHEIDQRGGAPPSLNEIQILNSFGRQGWVFESPAQCPQHRYSLRPSTWRFPPLPIFDLHH